MGGKSLAAYQVGEKFVTDERIMTVTDAETYSAITWNVSPVLLSDEYARSIGYKTRLVPGPLRLGTAQGLMLQAGLFGGIIALLGFEKVRFPAPCYPYDAIRVEGQVTGKRETKSGAIVVSFTWVARNQKGDIVVQCDQAEMLKKP